MVGEPVHEIHDLSWLASSPLEDRTGSFWVVEASRTAIMTGGASYARRAETRRGLTEVVLFPVRKSKHGAVRMETMF